MKLCVPHATESSLQPDSYSTGQKNVFMEPESQLPRSQVRCSCHLNLMQTLTPYFLKFYFNIILRNNRWSPKWY
jgi:hypothetical protein